MGAISEFLGCAACAVGCAVMLLVEQLMMLVVELMMLVVLCSLCCWSTAYVSQTENKAYSVQLELRLSFSPK